MESVFTFQSGDIQMHLTHVKCLIDYMKFTFQSGDIQIHYFINFAYLVAGFTFQSGDIQIIYFMYNDTIFKKIYIPIW